eukprot:CAMPEP_0197714520 /NCGR_PEP_ID=MMETSP1338-20131121/130998_2 /TAXON_ID=43686 ORGANISM="Pelagodinium beii, Strain RCC1491" /NCGR_SAMPLE_ID=MMETSP1338 /ASSEMBLY_ACC=CAM_ASM_000754 /LENGTH=111 /DNA_ID=CAMNT_0043298463 /DNA_START=162 /DNA_END=500 /DNA_ORIENTATION=-
MDLFFELTSPTETVEGITGGLSKKMVRGIMVFDHADTKGARGSSSVMLWLGCGASKARDDDGGTGSPFAQPSGISAPTARFNHFPCWGSFFTSEGSSGFSIGIGMSVTSRL